MRKSQGHLCGAASEEIYAVPRAREIFGKFWIDDDDTNESHTLLSL